MKDNRNLCARCASDYNDSGYKLTLISRRKDTCDYCGYRLGFLFEVNDVENFYHTPQWKRKQQRILRRDGYMCANCKRYGRIVQANTVHHIKHLEDYPELALDDANLISLCAACHNKAHPEKAKNNGGTRY